MLEHRVFNKKPIISETSFWQDLKELWTKVFRKKLNQTGCGWVKYDFQIKETRPPEYGKYFICRKDGKVHWETWNGSGWAYNGNVITHWMKITPPC